MGNVLMKSLHLPSREFTTVAQRRYGTLGENNKGSARAALYFRGVTPTRARAGERLKQLPGPPTGSMVGSEGQMAELLEFDYYFDKVG